MAYFHYSQGLRGCYMPDNASVIQVSTRRELKSFVTYDARDLAEAGMIGLSKKNISAMVAEAWRCRNKTTLDIALPYRNKKQTGYPYGIFLSRATRDEFKAYEAEND